VLGDNTKAMAGIKASIPRIFKILQALYSVLAVVGIVDYFLLGEFKFMLLKITASPSG